MKQKRLLLKISFVLLLLLAVLHTSFIIVGGPPMPTTDDFLTMQSLMSTIEIDAGAGIMRTMQNFMDGFNIIVSIFLFSLPVLGLAMLGELKNNHKGLNKLAVVNLGAMMAFFITSLSLLAIGGTVVSALVGLLLTISLLSKNSSEIRNT